MSNRLLAAVACSALVACGVGRQVKATSSGATACTSCHGDPSRAADPLTRAAPPVSTLGGSGGAHLAHLGKGVACGACHVVPTSPGHSNGVIEVVFSGVAVAGGATPAFAGGTCSGVYCHGATLGAGGKVPAPAWADGPLACDACHGAPPPSHAPTSTSCSTCHPGTVKPDGTIDVAGGLHANGHVEVGAGHAPGWADPAQHGPAAKTDLASCRTCHGANLDGVGGTGPSCESCHAAAGFAGWQSNCTFCHGTKLGTYVAANLASAAPPLGTRGETATTTRAVGAHQRHLTGGAVGPAVACVTCHVVPADLGHLDGVAAVVFGSAATRGGAAPVWNGASCGTTYCHGATIAGGTNKSPVWTGGSAQAACGTCHGVPPPAPHSTSTSCGSCHDGYTSTTVNPALHLNGVVDASAAHPAGWDAKEQHGYAANRGGLATCRTCHGASLDGVGGTGPSCASCHDAVVASWQTNCTFCHGARVSSYTSASLVSAAPPVGTQGETATTAVAVGAHQKHLSGGATGPAVACPTCHVVPADLAHVDGGPAAVAFSGPATGGGAVPSWNGATCASTYCHGGTLAGGANTAPSWTGGSAQAACGACHGIPPPAPHSTSTSCGSCHGGYTSTTVNLALHMNGVVDETAAHPAGWAAKEQHGYAANRGGLSACAACHGVDFAGGTVGVSCNDCHAGAGWAAWQTNCTFCHGTRVASYTSASLASAAPPVGTEGEYATTTRAVGAHQRHLAGGAIGAPVACATCHVVPADLGHVNGAATVTFGAPATAGGAAPVWNGATCASTYCHGATISGGTNKAPSWTGGSAQAACGTCHGVPPPAPHTTSTTCGDCHTGYTATAVNPALHLNGVVDATSPHPTGWVAKEQHGYTANLGGLASCKGCHGTSLDGVGGTGPSCGACHATAGFAAWQTTCTFCHGDRASGLASPPVDIQGRSATANVSVGAHASHLNSAWMPTPACAVCHPDRTGSNVITDPAHVDGDGVAEVVFGPLAKTGGAPATYTRTSSTASSCASVYCHGSFTGGVNGGAGATMSWTSTVQATCTSCHGAPPSTGHHSDHAGRSCGDCHPGYSTTAVNQATHVDGAKQVGNRITSWNPTTRTCTNTCHNSRTW